MANHEKTAQAAELLAAQVETLSSSTEFQRYLRMQARFHRYSANNVLLIAAQRPDATRVAGFKAWLGLGRCVRKGEKGIVIYVPLPRRARVRDEETGEEVSAVTGVGFGAGHVFDISQTDPLPDSADLPEPPAWERLAGNGEGLLTRLVMVATAEGITITRDGEGSAARGWYQPARKRLYVEPRTDSLDAAATLAHELAHYFAEHRGSEPASEVVADGAAFVVLAHFGFDAAPSSVPYVTRWSAGKPELVRAELGAIQRVATQIIQAVEGLAGTAGEQAEEAA